MNFYDKITADTALEWYAELPTHLKQLIDQERTRYKNGRECNNKEHPDIYELVKSELGPRPLKPAEPSDPLDGYTHEQMAQYEAHKKWANYYDELLLIKIILNNAEQIQNERRLLNKAMGIDNEGLPNQAEGLDPVQAATIAWIQNSGETPLEILAKMARDPEAKPSDRISAASKLMDYVHRRVPVKQEIKTEEITTPRLDPKVLKGLSEKELSLLEQLLAKLNNG